MDNLRHELDAAKARRIAIDRAINTLEAEARQIDARIAELNQAVGRADVPCWNCPSDRAIDIRHRLNNCQNVTLTASGLPIQCCKIASATFQQRPPAEMRF
jgi:hypothetical protein